MADHLHTGGPPSSGNPLAGHGASELGAGMPQRGGNCLAQTSPKLMVA